MSKDSSYLPFARKYRPKDFQELMGQEILVKTLSYCITNDKPASAILLTGIRGVGKTSSARIIAQTINCTDPLTNEVKIAIPCQQCKNCRSFQQHNHPDIIEIDAASKTGVDDVREVIESSEYRPILGKYKIFIVDEIHMFSKNAFNALLKLIEEPPPHLLFLFATTEAQKVPITVLSRCQRYDLRRLSFIEIAQLLKNIAGNENLLYEEEALKIIALKSEGSARDAVVMLDQLSSYSHNLIQEKNGLISASVVNKMLGYVAQSSILQLVQLVIAGNTPSAINLVEEIYTNSSNLEHFLEQTTDFIASLTKQKAIITFQDPLYQNYQTEIIDLLAGTSISRLSILWQIFKNGTAEIKSSHNELVTAEMLIFKAIYSCNMPKIEDILTAPSSRTSECSIASAGPVTHDIRVQDDAIEDRANQGPSPQEKSDIFSFLRFCHERKEMELYYTLLNEVEIKNFTPSLIELVTTECFTQEKNLKSLLSQWADGAEYKVTVIKQESISSLKQILLDKAKEGEDFALIKNHFPNADISDIILKI